MKEETKNMKSYLVNKQGFISIYAFLLLSVVIGLLTIYITQVSVLNKSDFTYEDIFIIHQVKLALDEKEKADKQTNDEEISDQTSEDETIMEIDESETEDIFIKYFQNEEYKFSLQDDYYEIDLAKSNSIMRVYFNEYTITSYEYLHS